MQLTPVFIDFIQRNTQLKKEEIFSELKLAEDIGFYGLDSIAFFEAFFSEFGIEKAENFDHRLYINGGPDFRSGLVDWIKNRWFKERRKYLNPDVTLGHLQKVIERGEWFNER